ncbi:glutamate--tRNA ligase [Candidatus Uhrbacteria bacterium CG10_big_fil_rev_8_21_14_0_10_50_16]|uniref:Glutamate--tRNA ligase n=1 Tax=Candidatus Uhrbacteria bacterium CG10_big_fil_rev_8_21_14_0_10_50_16 TaxID=1975039 RepID=A0A2H0RN55_9BACT|nr:MAG: glutamate--tRNA ligase [Candidatus Uhrbacteria bacterium CG10_big_fil_rev_8_21_14_0_10_50_16]
MKERTRFAPSPTGLLHIGGVRTALYAYFLAKQSGGDFLLRIEDTDQARSVENGVENIIDTLHRLGLDPDEGVYRQGSSLSERGDFGPYVQSKRLTIYAKYAQQLIADGHAYRCFCDRDRLDAMRKEQQANKEQPKYDRHCLHASDAEIEQHLKVNTPHVIRLHVPEGKTVIHDIIRGDVTFDHKEIDDQVLLKTDGFPTYHLAVVVDDHLMEITTVIRGEEWLSSTPKHLMLYTMLGWEAPRFAHVPLLLNADRSKLSKRQGDVGAEQYLEKGYLAETLVNFIATLGFNPTGDREIYSLKELIDSFDLKKVNKGGAVVNFEKLDWMNKQYLQQMSGEGLAAHLQDFGLVLEPQQYRFAEIEKTRAVTLVDLVERVRDLLLPPDYEAALLVWKDSDAQDATEMLKAAIGYVRSYGDVHILSEFELSMKEWIKAQDLQTGAILWPMRIALSGNKVSPSPFELVYALGAEESLRRMEMAIVLLQGSR